MLPTNLEFPDLSIHASSIIDNHIYIIVSVDVLHRSINTSEA